MYARVKRLPAPKRLCKNRWNSVLRISLIICTHNRAEILPRCLSAARNQSLNPREYEIIVVDNGSADHTAAVVRPFLEARDGPGVRYLFYPQRGLSRARNVGASAARAPIAAYIDDDAIADADLLSSLIRVYDEHPDAGCVGGRIEICLPPELPRWYTKEFAGYYSAYEPGYCEVTRIVEAAEFPYGANVSYRRVALDKAGYFQTSMGRIGAGQSGGEELDLEFRLARLGYGIYYAPRARVQHIVFTERLRWSHIAGTARAAGRNWAYYERELGVPGQHVRDDLRWFAGSLWRAARGQNRCVAYSQSIFYRAKIMRKLRYALTA